MFQCVFITLIKFLQKIEKIEFTKINSKYFASFEGLEEKVKWYFIIIICV